LNSIGVCLEQLVEIRDSMEEELEEAQAMLGTG
jgi:hypothetical protein